MHKIKKTTALTLAVSILTMLFSALSVFCANTESVSHVIINQVYGGGELGKYGTPVSHSFIELYNPTGKDISLEGWSVQYAESGTSWHVLALSGKIKSYSSFLIRCGEHSPSARLKISEYDLSWSIPLNNKGMKVLLKSNTEPCTVKNPYIEQTSGYVDMVGVAGNEYFYLIDGCEGDYSQIQSKQKSVRRKKFQDTDNNAADFAAIDYRTAELAAVRPRSSADGAWYASDFVRTKQINKVALTDSAKEEFTFLHISDTQASTLGQFKEWGALTDALAGADYDFSIHTGDITDNTANTEEMDMFYENIGELNQKPFLAVTGNHDKKSASLFEEYFGPLPGTEAPLPVTPGTTASFDYGNAHFVILNSESDLQVQAEWLDSELEKTDKKWKIVAIHRSPYGACGLDDTMVFTDIIDKHHVDLVLHGHDHLYIRTYPLYGGRNTVGGTVYLESGSSGIKQSDAMIKQSYQEVSIAPGAPAYSKITVGAEQIRVTAQALEDNTLKTIDSFSITKYSGEYDEPAELKYENTVRTFSDIRADRPFYDAVMLLAQLGIIEKQASFLPDSLITGAEFSSWLNMAGNLNVSFESDTVLQDDALRIIADSLGYGEYIRLSGKSYDYVADDIGLTDNIQLSGGGELTRGYAALLIKNALEAYIVKPVSFGSTGTEYAQVYENWLTNVHDIDKIRGIITDRRFYTEASSDGVTFVNEYGEENAYTAADEVFDLLGYEIDAYIKADTELIYGIKTKNNSELTVKKSWYGDITDVDKYIRFSYTNDDTGKSRSIKIDKLADFVYNGAKNESVRQKALAAEHNAFKPSHIGKIKLIDYNNDDVYDFVFIDNYKDIVVSGIDSENRLITNALEYQDGVSVKKSKYTEIPQIHLDETDSDYMVTFTSAEQKPSSFSSITKNSVVSVALSSLDTEDPESARIRRVYISNLSTAGKITEIYTEDDDDYFVVNGKSYRASKSYYNTYNGGESSGFPHLKTGDYVSLYIDYDERIAYIEYGADRKELYGIMTYCRYDETDDIAYARIIGEDGSAGTYTITRKRFNNYGFDSLVLPAMMKFSIDSGEILRAERTELDDSAALTYLSQSERLGNYFLSSGTRIFLYKGSRMDANTADSEHYTPISSQILRNKTVYDADIFKVSDYSKPTAVLLYYNDTDYELNDDDLLIFIRSSRQIVNDEDDVVYAVSGYVDGKEVVIELAYSETLAPHKGDIIRYRLDTDGHIEKWKKLCDYDSNEFEHNSIFDEYFFAKYDNIVTVKNGVITVDYDGQYKNYKLDESSRVYNISMGVNSFRLVPGDFDDIVRSDKIFITAREGITDEIYVWKND